MKKLILSIVIFIMAGTINLFAQSQEYIDAIGEMLEVYNIENLNKDEMKQMFITDLNESDSDSVVVDYESIVSKYMDTQYMEDIKHIYAEVYSAEVNIDEVRAITKSLSDKNLQQALANIHASSSILQEKVKEFLTANIIQNQEVSSPKLLPEVTPQYLVLVKKYEKAVNSKELIDNAINSITSYFGSQIQDEEQYNQIMQFFNGLFDIMKNNYSGFLANSMVNNVSEDELNLIINFYESEIGRKMNKASAAFSSNIFEIANKIDSKFKNWYKNNAK
ncbi:MAG: hypothetical protein MJZ32_09570 [Bacteroidaceae bacterium]|nr:hypothetical protein [Bacteroidaceae bacterium]